jgi:hypothetical protein
MSAFDSGLFGTHTQLVERSLTELQLKTQAHDGAFGLGRADWQAELQSGTLRFANESFQATCAVQIIGTYNTADGSWLWGWNHPSVPAPLALDAGRVRAFAIDRGLTRLLEPSLNCSEDDAWAFTALATFLAQSQGAYRGPAGAALVFMTFTDIQLQAAGSV